MDKEQMLDEIFNNDPLGLLKVKPKSSHTRTHDERLVSSFQEINEFIEVNGRLPEANLTSVSEYQLYFRLKSLIDDPVKVEMLKQYDIHSLLPEVESSQVAEPAEEYKKKSKEPSSIEDLLQDDNLGILEDDDAGLFDFKHTPKETSMPDYIASRKPCEDFEKFEEILKQCQRDLASGKRKVRPFKNEQQIDKGYFFVLNGILLYVAEIGEKEADGQGKMNTRLRCIFENGTESDLLLRSLSAELYKNGRRVTEHEDKMLDGLKGITDEDESVGFIYVLKTKSSDHNIQAIRNLYKIGYSRVAVEERIKNAETEATYLFAPVEYVAAWECYNLNPQKFEQLIHNFFGNSCLEVDVFDQKGKRFTPREWFIAPIDVIEQAIELIINEKIVDYQYDPKNSSIIPR